MRLRDCMSETSRPNSAVVLEYQCRPVVRRKGFEDFVVELVAGLTMVFLLIFAMMGIVLVFAILMGMFV